MNVEDEPEWSRRYHEICGEAYKIWQAGQMTSERFAPLWQAAVKCLDDAPEGQRSGVLDSLWRKRPDDWPERDDDDEEDEGGS